MGCATSTQPVGDDNGGLPEVRSNDWTHDHYSKIKKLGEGASCTVHMVEDRKTKEQFAMKVLQRNEQNEELFHAERDVMKLLKDPNIVEFYDAYRDDVNFYIFSVLCKGGELFDRVEAGKFSEKDAARLTRDMLHALRHCHSKNVTHRDLKPENFVFETKADDSSMKLIDFGCAKILKDDEIAQDLVGSAYYVAPEVIRQKMPLTGKVWRAADMWSIGIIIYLLVHGRPPFMGKSFESICAAIKAGKYKFNKRYGLSEDLKDIVRKLLKKDPNKRLTVEQALKHPWVCGGASDDPLPPEVTEGLIQFRDQVRLKKAVAHLLSQRLTTDDREQLVKVFKKFDENGDGELSAEEVAKMLKHIGHSEDDAKEIMEELDENDDGVIDQDEFVKMAVMGKLGAEQRDNKGQVIANASVDMAWKLLDKDQDGFITVQELEEKLNIDSEGAKELIKEVDANSDGKISFDEFLTAMTASTNKKGGAKK